VAGFTHADWEAAVCGGVKVCGGCGTNECGARQPHHIVYQQWIVEHVRTLAHNARLTEAEHAELLARLLYDPRNGMPVGYNCHRRHHSRHDPIPFALLPPAALEFAAELGLTHRIERVYP
jgi:hypothetical protein